MVNASKLNVESVTDYIVNWLKSYAENAKVKVLWWEFLVVLIVR